MYLRARRAAFSSRIVGHGCDEEVTMPLVMPALGSLRLAVTRSHISIERGGSP